MWITVCDVAPVLAAEAGPGNCTAANGGPIFIEVKSAVLLFRDQHISPSYMVCLAGGFISSAVVLWWLNECFLWRRFYYGRISCFLLLKYPGHLLFRRFS